MRTNSKDKTVEIWYDIDIQQNLRGLYAIITGMEEADFCYIDILKNSKYLVAQRETNRGTIYHKTTGKLLEVRQIKDMSDKYIIAVDLNNTDILIIDDKVLEAIVIEKVTDVQNNCYGFIADMKQETFKVDLNGRKARISKNWRSLNVEKHQGEQLSICLKSDENDMLIMQGLIKEGKMYNFEGKEISFIEMTEITVSGYSIGEFWSVDQYLCVREEETQILHLYDTKGRQIQLRGYIKKIKVAKEVNEIIFVKKEGIAIYDMETFELLLETKSKAIVRILPEVEEPLKETPLWYLIDDKGPWIVSKKNQYMITSNCKKAHIQHFGNYIYNAKDNTLFFLTKEGVIRPIMQKMQRKSEYQQLRIFGDMLIQYSVDKDNEIEYTIYIEDIPVVEQGLCDSDELCLEQIASIKLHSFMFVPIINLWYYFDTNKRKAFSCFHPIYWIKWLKQKRE